jgi:nucleoside-diphosphate-sugar epimerase
VELLKYAVEAGATQFVYLSTGSVYCESKRPLTESDPVRSFQSIDIYTASKLSGELLVGSFRSLLATAIVRPFFIYGPGQKRSMLIPRIYDKIASGEPIVLSSQDGLALNPVHAADVADAIAVLLAQSASGVFNCAGPDVITLRELAHVFGLYQARAPLVKQEPGASESLVARTSALESLGWSPHRRLTEHISDIAPNA